MFRRKQSTDVETAATLHEQGALLIDVRTKNEFVTGHVPGASHVSLQSLPNRADWIRRMATDRQVLVICRSGNRSGRATGQLRALGLDALNVRGGMIAWERKGLPTRTGKR
jgi:rhodanese-related sulfurtransferase